MLVPGVQTTAGAFNATAGAATPVAFINQGFGFTTAGALAIDTDSPTGTVYYKGFRMNPSTGAVYGTTTRTGSDVYAEGIRRTTVGQLVYEATTPVAFASGNPISSNNALAINSVSQALLPPNQSITSSNPGGSAIAGIRVNASGQLESRQQAVYANIMAWVFPGGSNPSDYEVLFTPLVGTPTGSATNTWINAGTSPEWDASAGVLGISTVIGTMFIRRADTQQIVAICAVTLIASGLL